MARAQVKKRGRSAKAGTTFPVARLQNLLKRNRYAKRISSSAAVFLAAVLEYLTAEVLEVAGCAAKDHNKSRLHPRHLALAVALDSELSQLFKKVTIPAGGVVPNIHETLEMIVAPPLFFALYGLQILPTDAGLLPIHSVLQALLSTAIQPVGDLRSIKAASLLLETSHSQLSLDSWQPAINCLGSTGQIGQQEGLSLTSTLESPAGGEFTCGLYPYNQLEVRTSGPLVKFVPLSVSLSFTDNTLEITGSCPGDSQVSAVLRLPCVMSWEKLVPPNELVPPGSACQELSFSETISIPTPKWPPPQSQQNDALERDYLGDAESINVIVVEYSQFSSQKEIRLFIRYPDVIGQSGIPKVRELKYPDDHTEPGLGELIENRDGLEYLELLDRRFQTLLKEKNIHDSQNASLLGNTFWSLYFLGRVIVRGLKDATAKSDLRKRLIDVKQQGALLRNSQLQQPAEYHYQFIKSTDDDDNQSMSTEYFVNFDSKLTSKEEEGICRLLVHWGNDDDATKAEFLRSKTSQGHQVECIFYKQKIPISTIIERPTSETLTPYELIREVIKFRNPATKQQLLEEIEVEFPSEIYMSVSSDLYQLVAEMPHDANPFQYFAVPTVEERFTKKSSPGSYNVDIEPHFELAPHEKEEKELEE